MEKFQNFQFIFLCGFALFSCVSVAISNIFLVLASIVFFFMLQKRYIFFDELVDKNILKLLLLFLTILVMASLCSDDIIYSLKEFWSVYFYRIWPFFLVLSLKRYKRKERLKYLIYCLGASVFIVSVYALYQATEGVLRANGFTKNPMYLAGLYCAIMPFFLITLIERNFFESRKVWLLILLIYLIGISGVLVNATRGAWLAIAISSLLILIIYSLQNRKIIIVSLIAVVTVCFVVNYNDYFLSRVYSISDFKNQSNNERLLLWRSSIEMFKDNPVLGVGPGRFTDKYQTKYISPLAKEPELRHAHSIYFQILSEDGLLGFISYITLFVYIMYSNFKKYLLEKEVYALMISCVILSVLIQGVTEFNAAVFKVFWFITGLCYLMMDCKQSLKKNF